MEIIFLKKLFFVHFYLKNVEIFERKKKTWNKRKFNKNQKSILFQLQYILCSTASESSMASEILIWLRFRCDLIISEDDTNYHNQHWSSLQHVHIAHINGCTHCSSIKHAIILLVIHNIVLVYLLAIPLIYYLSGLSFYLLLLMACHSSGHLIKKRRISCHKIHQSISVIWKSMK